MIKSTSLIESFKKHFDSSPTWMSRAPGRVNLIGEHTDYNGGFVMPCAIDREVRLVASPSDDDQIHLCSIKFGAHWEGKNPFVHECPRKGSWPSYFLAVVDQFQRRGYTVPPLRICIDGDVPAGAGLSSSAAFEVATAVLLNGILNAGLSLRELALLAQAAENGPLVGVNCGIMDQYASALGQTDSAIKLDCHTVTHEYASFDSSQAAIMIINSMKKRGLVDSEYNTRRRQCEEGLQTLCDLAGESYETLRHVPVEAFDRFAWELDSEVMSRVRHNVTENQRVKGFAKALNDGDLVTAGKLLYESHSSLRDDFEVSCKELDTIVTIARELPGLFGCRMTGAGFGGCAVALVKPEAVEDVATSLANRYEEAIGLCPEIIFSKPSAGAEFSTL